MPWFLQDSKKEADLRGVNNTPAEFYVTL